MKIYWRCYPPFVDAYHEAPVYEKEPYNPTKIKAIEDLHEATKSNASDWGTYSIEEQAKRSEIFKVNEKFVLSLGSFFFENKSGKETKKSFVILSSSGNPYEDSEIIEYDYPSSWNVT